MQPSKYQNAIFDFVEKGRGSAIVQAVAGSGKTTTIVKALEKIAPSNAVAFLAFNKSIATELKARVPRHVEAMTLNSLGHRAVTKYAGRFLKVDAKKTRTIAMNALTQEEQYNLAAIQKLVSLAKAHGIVPSDVRNATGLIPDTLDSWMGLLDRYDLDITDPKQIDNVVMAARRVLTLSLNRTDLIDFDDQLYMTVALNIPTPRYDFLFVDESQDVSPIQRALLRKALKPGGRLIAVGDSWQSIYGFRGADSNAMDNIAKEFNCVTLPLSISYRCAKNIVAYAKLVMPDIEASETAPDGEIMCMPYYEASDFSQDDMLVCRNTKPLIQMAYSLIAKMVPVRVMGREIGQGLVSLIEKLRPKGIEGEHGLVDKLHLWVDKEMQKHMATGNEQKAEVSQDKADTILTFIYNSKARTVPQLIDAINAMFDDDPHKKVLTLSTIHRAKGLEAPRVFILDEDLMPSRFARQEWQMRQEKNLYYVAVTRAKQSLVFIRSGCMVTKHESERAVA